MPMVGGRKNSLLPTPVALPAIEHRRLEHDVSLSLPPMTSNVGTPESLLGRTFSPFQRRFNAMCTVLFHIHMPCSKCNPL